MLPVIPMDCRSYTAASQRQALVSSAEQPLFLALTPGLHPKLIGQGKAAGLARLLASQAPVPPACLLAPELGTDLLRKLPAWHTFEQAWCRYQGDDLSLDAAYVGLGKALSQASPPPGWVAASRKLWQHLAPHGALIVRSSAAHEDGLQASFAGMYHSERVSPAASPSARAEALWQAVCACLLSFYQPEACRYYLSCGLDPKVHEPRVIVQRFVQAQIAGIAFEGSLQGGSSTLIEWGLGDCAPLVEGQVQTFSYCPEEVSTEPPLALRPFLRALRTWLQLLHRQAGFPIDCEWAYDGQRLWFLQLRPQTGLHDSSQTASTPSQASGLWSRRDTQERFPEALSPMGWSILGDTLEVNIAALRRWFYIKLGSPRDLVTYHQHYVYGNDHLLQAKAVRLAWRELARLWLKSPQRWRASALIIHVCWRALWRAGKKRMQPLLKTQHQPRHELAFFLQALKLVHFFCASRVQRIAAEWQAHHAQQVSGLEALRQDLHATDELDQKGCEAAIARLQAISRPFFEADIAVFALKRAYYSCVEKIWGCLGLSASALLTELNSDRPHAFTALTQELQELQAVVGSSADWSHPAAQAFIERHGHMGVSWDVMRPVWRESLCEVHPSVFLRQTPRDKHGEAAPATPPPLPEPLQEALVALKAVMTIDDEQNYRAGAFIEASRLILLRAGRYLSARGVLSEASEVFFLSLEDLASAYRDPSYARYELCRRRRIEFERSSRCPPPFYLDAGTASQAPEDLATAKSDPRYIVGLGVSPGQASGHIRYVRSLADARQVDSTTVAALSNPQAGLLPALQHAAGVICETGGALAHGFLLAREFRLPAVSGVPKLFARLREGQRISLDGQSGLITLDSIAPEPL